MIVDEVTDAAHVVLTWIPSSIASSATPSSEYMYGYSTIVFG